MRLRTIALSAAVVVAFAATSWAQRRPPPPGPVPPPGKNAEGLDINSRFGLSAAEKLLKGGTAERIRGIRRLASIGTPQAIEKLVQSQGVAVVASLDLTVRLEAVRALARFVDQDEPRQVVVQALATSLNRSDGQQQSPEMVQLLRGTAAMVLAASGNPRAVQALVNEIRHEGASASVARAALRAFPPQQFGVIVGDAQLSLPMAEFLGDLGDLRAIPKLREALREGDAKMQATAVVALAKLGDADAAVVVRPWVNNADPVAKYAAAQTLTRLAPSEASAPIAALLETDSHRTLAIELASQAPSSALAKPLAAIASNQSLDAETRSNAVSALGKCGGSAAASALVALFDDPVFASDAAFALAMSPGDSATESLRSRIKTPAHRALAIRAATVRALTLRENVSGLREAASEALRGDDANRAAGAFAKVALGEASPDDSVLLDDPATLSAAVRGALAHGRSTLAKLSPALVRAGVELASIRKDSREASTATNINEVEEARARHKQLAEGVQRAALRRDTLALSLAATARGGQVPSIMLREWIEDGGATSVIALRALVSRDEEDLQPRLAKFATHADPIVRGHFFAGLGDSPEGNAAGRLVSGYWFETSVNVRAQIVRALSRRSEPVRDDVLHYAAKFEPDSTVRQLAISALWGAKHDDFVFGDLSAWYTVVSRSAEKAPVKGPFLWRRPEGIALPVVPDPDGSLVLPSLQSGTSRVVRASFMMAEAFREPTAAVSASAAALLPPPGATGVIMRP